MLRLSLAFATAGLTASQTTTAAATATAAATTTTCDAYCEYQSTCKDGGTCEYCSPGCQYDNSSQRTRDGFVTSRRVPYGNSSSAQCDTMCEYLRVHGNSASVVTGLAAVMMSLLLTFA